MKLQDLFVVDLFDKTPTEVEGFQRVPWPMYARDEENENVAMIGEGGESIVVSTNGPVAVPLFRVASPLLDGEKTLTYEEAKALNPAAADAALEHVERAIEERVGAMIDSAHHAHLWGTQPRVPLPRVTTEQLLPYVRERLGAEPFAIVRISGNLKLDLPNFLSTGLPTDEPASVLAVMRQKSGIYVQVKGNTEVEREIGLAFYLGRVFLVEVGS